MVLFDVYMLFIAIALLAFYLLVYLFRFLAANFGEPLSDWISKRRSQRAEAKRHAAAKDRFLKDGYSEKLAEFLADHEDLEPLYAERNIKGE